MLALQQIVLKINKAQREAIWMPYSGQITAWPQYGDIGKTQRREFQKYELATAVIRKRRAKEEITK